MPIIRNLESKMVTDALGQVFNPIVDAQRIVSLVPSTTETLCRVLSTKSLASLDIVSIPIIFKRPNNHWWNQNN